MKSFYICDLKNGNIYEIISRYDIGIIIAFYYLLKIDKCMLNFYTR